VDTLDDSKYANMKELRFNAAEGVWRVVFAFDTKRKAILLVAGEKSGGSQARSYRELIRKADLRFDAHLARVKAEETQQNKVNQLAAKKPVLRRGRNRSWPGT
jgi:hypothetical protein